MQVKKEKVLNISNACFKGSSKLEEKENSDDNFYLQFIFGWVLSEFLHHTAELGDADVAAAVDVVLEERLFMMMMMMIVTIMIVMMTVRIIFIILVMMTVTITFTYLIMITVILIKGYFPHTSL